MKAVNWIGAVVALLFLFCAMTSLQSYGQRFDQPPTHGGRTLTEDEFFTLQSAMAHILLPPPESLKFADENGDSHTVSCLIIGLDLMDQLRSGRVEAETVATGNWTNPDGKEGTEGDGMNVDPGLVGAAGQADSNMRALEGVLVHEWGHKKQDSTALADTSGREIGPYGLAYAYYCSTGVDCTRKDWLPGWANDQLQKRKKEYEEHHLVHGDFAIPVDDDYIYVKSDTMAPGGQDSLMCMHISGSYCNGYPLAPMRGSDFYVIENSPFVPPGHDLVVISGGVPEMGIARIIALDAFEGEIVGQFGYNDFGPPFYPPMFFFSMERAETPGQWYVVDTLNHQVLLMEDIIIGEGIPDQILFTYADAIWPGFEPLHGMLGVDKGTHPFMGPGLLVNMCDAHHYDLLYPFDEQFFIGDANGDLIADFIVHLPLYEFLQIRPVIQVPLPWQEESVVQIYGTWEHDISVWATDETGEIMFEQLGMTHLGPGIEVTCPLVRPVLAGEFLMPEDMQTGKRARPTQVIDPTPQHLTIQYHHDGNLLQMNWQAVPGAGHYEIYSSENGVNFHPTGFFAETNEFCQPVSPLPKQFYRVVAVR